MVVVLKVLIKACLKLMRTILHELGKEQIDVNMKLYYLLDLKQTKILQEVLTNLLIITINENVFITNFTNFYKLISFNFVTTNSSENQDFNPKLKSYPFICLIIPYILLPYFFYLYH